MGIIKRHMLQQAEEEAARLDREWKEAHPELAADWDRETWEAMQASLDKDD